MYFSFVVKIDVNGAIRGPWVLGEIQAGRSAAGAMPGRSRAAAARFKCGRSECGDMAVDRPNMPENLKEWIKKGFDELVDDAMRHDECGHTRESGEEEVSLILSALSRALDGEPIYRAIEVDDVSGYLSGLKSSVKKKGRFGHHWSTNVDGADVKWDYNDHSFGWYHAGPEPAKGWKKGPGIIIIEARIVDPSAVDFESTISEQFQCEFCWGDTAREESEVTIKDDTKLLVTAIGSGTTVFRARADIEKKKKKAAETSRRPCQL